MTVTLASVCHAVRLYEESSSKATPTASWQSIDWLWASLSSLSKAAGAIGLLRWQYFRQMFLLQPILIAAEPYLEKYLAGEWRKQDEERLAALLQCISQLSKESGVQRIIDRSITEKIKKLLLEGVSHRSFAAVKRQALERLEACGAEIPSSLHSEINWRTHETFAQYTKRLSLILSSREKQPDAAPMQKKAAAELSFDEPERLFHIDTKPLAALELRLESLIRKLSYQSQDVQAHVIVKVMAARYVLPESVHRIEALLDTIFRLLVLSEQHLDRVVTIMGMGLIDAAKRDALERDIEAIQNTIVQIETEKAAAFISIEAIKDSATEALQKIDTKVSHLFRLLDNEPLLPLSSRLRPQQLKIIKSAREKLKQYKTSIDSPAAMHCSIFEIESDIQSLHKLAHELYLDGMEIETFRHTLRGLRAALKQRAAAGLDPSVEMMLNEIESLDETLEFEPNRQTRLSGLQNRAAPYL